MEKRPRIEPEFFIVVEINVGNLRLELAKVGVNRKDARLVLPRLVADIDSSRAKEVMDGASFVGRITAQQRVRQKGPFGGLYASR